MAESGYGLAGWEWDRRNLSISTGLRRASAVLLRYHMQQLSAAFHAANAASVGGNIRKVMHVYIGCQRQ